MARGGAQRGRRSPRRAGPGGSGRRRRVRSGRAARASPPRVSSPCPAPGQRPARGGRSGGLWRRGAASGAELALLPLSAAGAPREPPRLSRARRGPGSMGGARVAGWVAAGLALGAGACYCVYRLARGRGGRGQRLRPSRSAEDLTNGSYDDVLNAEQLQKLLYLLESTEDPVIIERALVTLGNSAAFSANQVIIRELGGIPIVGSKINSPNHSIKEKALNALNNLSVNVENQIKIKIYISQVCEDVFSGPLNSAVQLAGLRLLTNMTVTNDHQHLLSSYITDLFHVLLTGHGPTKVQVLKLLLNLSENPAMAEGLLGAQVDSSFLSLYDGHVAKEILLRVLTLFQNINNCLQKEGRLAVQPPFTKGSLFFLLYGEECAQKMRALLYHPDAEVKEKVTIIPES
ncbi:armadillo repeat-containing protein 10 [Equus asinus]